MQHWANGHYPWTLPRMPLPWREDYAANLAAAWTHQLSIARGRYPHFHARFNTTLGRPPTLVGTVLRVTFSPPGLPPDYGMLVSGTGFGTENCTVDNSPGGTGSGRYAGFRFWDTDDFARPNLNIPSPAHAEVLISGGGDGALQDCLRIMTQGLSAKQIYQQLYNPATTGPLPAWIELEQTIQSAEDQAQRAYIWGERRHDHAVHHRLHRAHQRAIAQLLSHSSIQSHLWSVLQSLIKAPQPGITLAHPCTHFSQCYGLNRFLVLLFAAYLAHTPPGSNPLRLNTSVQYVDCHHPPP